MLIPGKILENVQRDRGEVILSINCINVMNMYFSTHCIMHIYRLNFVVNCIYDAEYDVMSDHTNDEWGNITEV